MIINAPRIFAVVQINDGSIVYSSEQYIKAKSFMNALPDGLVDCFALVRYDPNPEYATVKEN